MRASSKLLEWGGHGSCLLAASAAHTLLPRPSRLALEALKEAGFLTANVSACTTVDVDIKVVAAAARILAKVAVHGGGGLATSNGACECILWWCWWGVHGCWSCPSNNNRSTCLGRVCCLAYPASYASWMASSRMTASL